MGLKARIFQKIFGSTGPTAEFGKIGSKAAASPVKTKDLDLMQTLSQYEQGLAAIISDQGTSQLPYLEDLNSLFFLMTSQLAYIMQSGVPEWDAETEYYQFVSMVLFGGEILIDIYGTPGTPNIGFNPSTNPAKWKSQTLATPTITGLLSGASASFPDGIKITNQSEFYAVKRLDIGNWNMDAVAFVTIAHGLSKADIINVEAFVRDDSDIGFAKLCGETIGGLGTGWIQYFSTNISLERVTGGIFDDTGYNATSYNRGHILITYKV